MLIDLESPTSETFQTAKTMHCAPPHCTTPTHLLRVQVVLCISSKVLKKSPCLLLDNLHPGINSQLRVQGIQSCPLFPLLILSH